MALSHVISETMSFPPGFRKGLQSRHPMFLRSGLKLVEKLRQGVHGGDFCIQLVGEEDGRCARAAANLSDLQGTRSVEPGQRQHPLRFSIPARSSPKIQFMQINQKLHL